MANVAAAVAVVAVRIWLRSNVSTAAVCYYVTVNRLMAKQTVAAAAAVAMVARCRGCLVPRIRDPVERQKKKKKKKKKKEEQM